MKEKLAVQYDRLDTEISNDESETSSNESEKQTSDIFTPAISEQNGLMPVQVNSVRRFYVQVCGVIFYVMGFFGFFCFAAISRVSIKQNIDYLSQNYFYSIKRYFRCNKNRPTFAIEAKILASTS